MLKAANNSKCLVRVCSVTQYDFIIIGSGNGACGFLHALLARVGKQKLSLKIAVIEDGQSFYTTSDFSHQNSWAESYNKTGRMSSACIPRAPPPALQS
jgi:hypothetical protein